MVKVLEKTGIGRDIVVKRATRIFPVYWILRNTTRQITQLPCLWFKPLWIILCVVLHVEVYISQEYHADFWKLAFLMASLARVFWCHPYQGFPVRKGARILIGKANELANNPFKIDVTELRTQAAEVKRQMQELINSVHRHQEPQVEEGPGIYG